jgi:hypothetical protein
MCHRKNIPSLSYGWIRFTVRWTLKDIYGVVSFFLFLSLFLQMVYMYSRIKSNIWFFQSTICLVRKIIIYILVIYEQHGILQIFQINGGSSGYK